jgi:hypothetical protein
MHYFLFVAGLAVGQAAATGWRLDAQKYSCPQNTNNQCSTDQKTGYNWDNLEPGSFSSYGSNKFSGFKCGNSFGKRDGVTKRAFQDKCITADIDKEPKIECDGKDNMTIDSYQVSSSWDTDIDAHHEMPDGSVCKQTHRCTQGGNTVQNTQCAGSTKVTFKPKRGESGKNENGESCSIGIHSIGFKCDDNGPSTTQPAYSASTTSSEVETTSSAASSYGSSSEVETISSYESSSTEMPTTSSTEISPETTSSAASSYETSSEVETVSSYASSSIEISTTSSTEISPETTSSATSSEVESISSYGSSSSEVPTTSSTEASPETTGIPAFSSYANISSTAPVESSVGVPTSYAVADSSSAATTSTEVSPESSAPAYESSSTAPANSSAPVYSATTSSDAEVPTETYATPNTPDLLPQCVNTWIGQTKCKDNADSTCYCRDAEFVKQVMGCIEAWSDDDDQTQGAASYFQGICAPYVPQNPAIITACPSAGKPTATPVSESSSIETSAETAPVYSTSSTEGSPVTTDVPEQPEQTAPTYETSSTEGSPVTTSPVEMTTSTVYTTAVSTITSCAADVKDCPAASQTTAVVTQTVAVSTTVCPVSEAETTASSTDIPSSTEGSPVITSSDTPAESPPATTAPAEPSTLTYYSTSIATITSCAADVTDCPASSTVVSEIPVSYTVIETPTTSSEASPEQVTSATASSSAAPAPYTSEVPAATSPATAPAGPSTTITYCSSIQVPATYSTGESYGQEIPGSSTYATIDTTITVPQVQFVTSTITVPGSTGTISVGLAAGSPPAAPAYPTPTADAIGGSAKPTGSSGFGTSYVPSSTGSPITPYTGSASSARTSVAGLAIGAVLALFVM